MGRVRNLRLPDEMEDDVDKYLAENRIKFTDLVISGIAAMMNEGEIPPCHSKAEPEIVAPVSSDKAKKSKKEPETVKVPIIKSVQDASKVLELAVKRPEYASPAHHPQCSCGVCKPA